MSQFQEYLESRLKKIVFEKTPEVPTIPEYDINVDVMELVRNERLAAGLTQKQLAELTGLSQGKISKIETGQSVPNLLTLKKIADGVKKRLVISFEKSEEEELYVDSD